MVKRVLRQSVFYFTLLLLWESLCLLNIWPPYLFPSPFQVADSLVSGLRDLSLLMAIGASLKRLLIGFIISVIIGCMIGVIIYGFKVLDGTLGRLVSSLRVLPSICWLPMSLLWFGLNEKAVIFVVVMGALFSVSCAFENGMKNVNPLYINVGRNMGWRGLPLLTGVIIPAAMPEIFSGLKQGWAFAWRSLLAAEIVFSNLGLGYHLMLGRELNDMSMVAAVMVVIAFISVLIDKLIFGRMEEYIRNRWGIS